MNLRNFLTLLLAGLAGFSSLANGEEGAKAADAPVWPPKGYERVVAYHFRSTPSDDSSVIWNGKVDREMLKKVQIKSAELSKDQIATVLKATRSQAKEGPRYACYLAHHVFLFLDKDDNAVGAFEVCFECKAAKAEPADRRKGNPDYRTLAKICEETVGMEDGQTSAKVAEDLDRYDKETEEYEKAEKEKADKSPDEEKETPPSEGH